MRQVNVVTNTIEYQKLLVSSGPNRHREISDQELKALPNDAYILTGEKTKSFGGGPSPDGFVISGGKMSGRIRLAGRPLQNGKVTILK